MGVKIKNTNITVILKIFFYKRRRCTRQEGSGNNHRRLLQNHINPDKNKKYEPLDNDYDVTNTINIK
ncbi:hypothetical protein Trydic_g6877 [Trypoxylus dichotomus]